MRTRFIVQEPNMIIDTHKSFDTLREFAQAPFVSNARLIAHALNQIPDEEIARLIVEYEPTPA